MKRTPMFLHLFHGRNAPDEDMSDWGFEGPVLKIEGFHVTYESTYRIGISDEVGDEDWEELHFDGGCLYYAGKWYGDWSIFAAGTDPDLEARVEWVVVKSLAPEGK
jgi:hypothetical protein